MGSSTRYFSVGGELYRQTLPKPDPAFLEAFEAIRALRARLQKLPDRCASLGLDYDPPSDQAIAAADAVLVACIGFSLRPDRVVASAEGGASVVFFSGVHRISLECLNSGSMVASLIEKGQPADVWDFSADSIYATLLQVSAELGG